VLERTLEDRSALFEILISFSLCCLVTDFCIDLIQLTFYHFIFRNFSEFYREIVLLLFSTARDINALKLLEQLTNFVVIIV
jgi:hypothetical protein